MSRRSDARGAASGDIQGGSGRDARYWLILYAMLAVGVGATVFLPDPTLLVSLAATGTVVLAPFWTLMIVLSVHRLPAEDRPPRWLRAWAWAGVVGAAVIAGTVAWLVFGVG